MTGTGSRRLPRALDALGAPDMADATEWIDREHVVTFSFEGQTLSAFAGDSVASALWAHGHRVLGRSSKKRRPRGLDANVALTERKRGILVAEQTPIAEGMDLRRVHEASPPALPPWTVAGSKIAPGGLHDPARLGEASFERSVRAWVGLGLLPARAPAPLEAHAVGVAKPTRTVDVLVVGAGLAGLSAALAAAEGGCGVLVVDSSHGPGGRAIATPEGRRELAARLRHVNGHLAIELRAATTALGIYDDGLVPLLSEARVTRLRARRIIVATGRLDLPAVFGNNDLPGVMSMATAARLLLRYGVVPCRRAVVLTLDDAGLRCAELLRESGVEVAAIVDARSEGTSRTAPVVIHGGLVHEGVAACDGSLGGVIVRAGERPFGAFACDGLIVSGATIAADQLVLQAQRKTRPAFEPIAAQVSTGVWAAGSVRGFATSADCVEDGTRVGHGVAASLGRPPAAPAEKPADAPPFHPADLPLVRHPEGACFVDLDEDVEVTDLDVAIDEGFDQVGLLNAYTKFGRGVGQSKTSHAQAIGVLAERTATPVALLGRPVPRPPVRPVPMQLLAGRRFHPRRRTPLHDWHAGHGATFLVADDWERPAAYDAVACEVRLVRERVGIIDVGTLGKIDVVGPGAGAFLDHVYTGRFADMKIGSTRYALLCDDAGAIVDDGVVARFAADRFYVTTTTTASAAVYREMQRWAIDLGADVVLTNLTGAIAAFNVAGPLARQVIARAADDALRVAACPYLGALETTIRGVAVRVLRVGFVGEVGYELHVPASAALTVWSHLIESGAPLGMRPFGVEAQRMLRLEKGHLLVGQDTDALSTPFEVGLTWAVKMGKTSFIGRRSLAIRALRPRTRALVGFSLDDVPHGSEPRECHLVLDGPDRADDAGGRAITGRVTSVGRSPSLGKIIGLAFVAPAAAAPGQSFTIRIDRSRSVNATVVRTPFYDPENARQHAPDTDATNEAVRA